MIRLQNASMAFASCRVPYSRDHSVTETMLALGPGLLESAYDACLGREPSSPRPCHTGVPS